MEHLRQFFIEQYKQCHEHVRDTDKKRDQVVALYGGVVGLLVTNFDKIGEKHRSLVFLGTGIAGILVSLIVMNYRKWHSIHLNSATVIDYLLRESKMPTAKAVEEAWYLLVKKRNLWQILNPFGSIDTAVFYFLTLVSLLPWYVFMREQNVLSSLPSTVVIFLLIVYVVVFALIAFSVVRCAEKEPDWGFWAFRALGRPAGKRED